LSGPKYLTVFVLQVRSRVLKHKKRGRNLRGGVVHYPAIEKRELNNRNKN
jgi:hypothetical protein